MKLFVEGVNNDYSREFIVPYSGKEEGVTKEFFLGDFDKPEEVGTQTYLASLYVGEEMISQQEFSIEVLAEFGEEANIERIEASIYHLHTYDDENLFVEINRLPSSF